MVTEYSGEIEPKVADVVAELPDVDGYEVEADASVVWTRELFRSHPAGLAAPVITSPPITALV